MSKTKQIVTSLIFHIAIGITVWFLIFNAITSLIGYYSFNNSYKEEYKESAFRTAELSAAVVNGDYIDEYLSFAGKGTVTDQNGNDYFDINSFTPNDEYGEAYKDQWTRLDILSHKLDVNLVYVIAIDTTDYASFKSVINCPNSDKVPYKPWTIGHTEKTNEQYTEIYKKMYAGTLDEAYVMRTKNLNGSVPHVTALLPIKNSAGETVAVLCVQRSMEELTTVSKNYLTKTLLSTVGLIIISVIIMILYLRREFITPTHKIISEAERFAIAGTINDDFKLGEQTKIREIKQMADSLKKMEQDTVNYIENLTTVTAERERIDTELTLAKRIQANVLPSLFPPFPDRYEFDIFASMTPAKEVGGDFYDFFLIDKNHLGLVMADVSGKGVPAALFMMATKNLIKTYALNGGTPSEILTAVNREICKSNHDDMFVTVWLGILDLTTGNVTAANAGHEYPVIKHRNGSFELFKDKHGFVIGGIDTSKYRDYEFKLGLGDSLFLYTDGVPEANNKNLELFGNERMLKALNRATDDSPRSILAAVNNAINNFVGDAPAFDDITMMSIKFNAIQNKNSITTHPDMNSVSIVSQFLNNRSEHFELQPKLKNKLQIAVDEIYSNIMRYSTAETATVFCEKQENSVVLTFIDDGVEYDPTAAKKPDITLSAEDREIGGLGIFMVKNTARSMNYSRENNKNKLTIEYKI